MTKNIHFRALKGAIRGVRKPGHKMTADERYQAARRAKEAEGSETYRLLETGQKLNMPSAEEQRRMRKKYALQYTTGGSEGRHLFDPATRKLRPEHRQSVLGHVEAISRSDSSAMIPERLRQMQETSSRLKGRETLALVGNEWFYVSHVRGRADDGYNKPFFIGIGNGYDITRFIIWAPNQDEAVDVAETSYPRFFFTEIIAPQKLKRLIADGTEDENDWRFIESMGKLGKPEQDIRIFEQAREVAYHAKKIGEYYRLTDGRLVEAH